MLRKILSSQLRINMASGVVTHGINLLVLAVMIPVCWNPDFLGKDLYGVWLALGAVIAFAQIGDLGVSHAVMKLVAEEQARGNSQGVGQYAVTALLILLSTGLFILVIVLCFRSWLIGLYNFPEALAPSASWLLPWIGVLSVYILLLQVMFATLSGLGRMDLANYAQTGGRTLGAIISISLLVFGQGLKSLIIGNFASCVVAHIVVILLIRRIATIRFLNIRNVSLDSSKKLLRLGSGIVGGSVASMMLDPFNKFMLTRFGGVALVPVYDLAWRGCQQVRALGEVGLRALMPKFSEIGAESTDAARLRTARLFQKTMKTMALFGGGFYLTLFVFSSPLLRVWLREQFDPSVPVAFRILLVGSYFSLLGAVCFHMFMGRGQVLYVFLAKLIPACANVVLVIAVVVWREKLTVEQLSVCLLIATLLSSGFLLWKAREYLFLFPRRDGEIVVP